ncbi:MAG: hypothetical protein FWD65_00440 [Coriobacteriia bacterium]|nr:hypothetical protein [Coriobacteriia bacterium]
MKVRYREKTLPATLTQGKIYQVLATDHLGDIACYRIVDDSYQEDIPETWDGYLFGVGAFEVEDPEPDVYVPTDEEYWEKRRAEPAALGTAVNAVVNATV